MVGWSKLISQVDSISKMPIEMVKLIKFTDFTNFSGISHFRTTFKGLKTH